MVKIRRMTARRLHAPDVHSSDIERHREITQRVATRGSLGRAQILQRYDIRPQLSALHIPTLFLAADGVSLVPAVAEAQGPRQSSQVVGIDEFA
jgi:hypothetical protein